MIGNGRRGTLSARQRAECLRQREFFDSLKVDEKFFESPEDFASLGYFLDTIELTHSTENDRETCMADGEKAISESQLLEKFSSTAKKDMKDRYYEKISMIDDEMRLCVEKKSEGFNNSLRNVGEIFQELSNLKIRVRRLKKFVHKSKEALKGQTRSIGRLCAQQAHELQIIEILNQIEKAKNAPAQIRVLLSQNRINECLNCYFEAESIVNMEIIKSIPALKEISVQVSFCRDEIIESLTGTPLRFLQSSMGTDPLVNRVSENCFDESFGHRLIPALLGLIRFQRLNSLLDKVMEELPSQVEAIWLNITMKSTDKKKASLLDLGKRDLETDKLVDLIFKFLSELKFLLNQHFELSRILKKEKVDLSKTNYSQAAVWDIVQNQVRKIVDFYANDKAPISAQSEASFRRTEQENSVIPNFKLSLRKEIAKPVAKILCDNESTAMKFISFDDASPFLLLPLISHLHDFAHLGDALANTTKSSRFLDHILSLCETRLLPRMTSDGLAELVQTQQSDFDPKFLAKVCIEQIFRVASEAKTLDLLKCSLNPVFFDLMHCFNKSLEERMVHLTDGRLCQEWIESVGIVVNDDPLFSIFTSKPMNQLVFDKSEYLKWKESYGAFLREERKKEMNFLSSETGDKGSTTASLQSQLLSVSEIAELSSIISACYMVFKILAFDHKSSSFSNDEIVALGWLDEVKIKMVLRSEPVKALLCSKEIKALLSEIHNTRIKCISMIRFELRMRCIHFINCLPQEMLQRSGYSSDGSQTAEGIGTKSNCIDVLIEELVGCVRAIAYSTLSHHRAYTQASLCTLISELLLRAMDSYASITNTRPPQSQIEYLAEAAIKLEETMSGLVELEPSVTSLQLSGPAIIANEKINLSKEYMIQEHLHVFESARYILACLEKNDAILCPKTLASASQAMFCCLKVEELQSLGEPAKKSHG